MGVEEIVERLELNFMSAGVCLPCLTFVAFPLDSGDERRARHVAGRITPDLWAEGLELTTMLALEEARRDQVPGATAALEDVRRHGPRSAVVKAIVWRLAEQMVEDIRRRQVRASRVARALEPAGP